MINNAMNSSYEPNLLHRNHNPNKSQWIISKKDEHGLFKQTYSSNWIYNDNNKLTGFGIKKNNNRTVLLGYSAVIYGRKELKIAKFIENQNIWHGYPADYRTHKADTPSTEILKIWFDDGYINKKNMCKILKGQKCNL